ncbi:MAG: hypothetical protein AABY22_30595, partial [Nanoarchaeota archaeon]
TLILAVIVYFKFFFFNRFIIFLDIALIILSGNGLHLILEKKKTLAIIIIIVLLSSALIMSYKESVDARPTIPGSIFGSIDNIIIPEDSYIISISSAFSPFLQGWTNNRIIAPGLFDYDIWHSEARWNEFWKDLNASELKEEYSEDVYLFTNNDLNTTCYQKKSQNLYKWMC